MEAAALRLASTGAFVRVRVESNVGSDADGRMSFFESRCPDWRKGASRRPDVISVIVLTDTRKTGIYYRSNYASALDNSWRSIHDADMNPRFKEGFFDDGISKGLDAITKTIKPRNVKVSNGSKAAPALRSSGSLGDAVIGAIMILGGLGFIIGLFVVGWKVIQHLSNKSAASTDPTKSRRFAGWVDGPESDSPSRSSSYRSRPSSRRSSSSGRRSGGGGGSSSW